MDWYRITLRPASPSATAWQADTIFGHLCWALAYTEGPDFLETFLGLYQLGDPPLLVSNGFPGDLLPRPLVRSLRKAQTGDYHSDRQAFRERKRLRKAAWLSFDAFQKARRGQPYEPEPDDPFDDLVTMHNQINRLTGTTGDEGNLYPLEATTLSEVADGRITVYALADPGFVTSLKRCLRYLEATGYGKRKSAGMGAIREITLDRFDGFEPVEEANGFLSLSNFVPAADDPVDGVWNTLVKRGKLGEELAVSGKPFKRPLVMLVAGSCFRHWPLRRYYGRLVPNVHAHFPFVVQYGLALPISIRLPGSEVTQ